MTVQGPLRDSDGMVCDGTTDALERAEQIVLWAARLWFVGSTRPAAAACWPEDHDGRYANPAGETAAAQLHGLLNIMFAEVERPLDFRCASCHLIGRDEKPFLTVLAAFQAGRDDLGQNILASWLPAATVAAATRLARNLADTLAAVNLLLPLEKVQDDTI